MKLFSGDAFGRPLKELERKTDQSRYFIRCTIISAMLRFLADQVHTLAQ